MVFLRNVKLCTYNSYCICYICFAHWSRTGSCTQRLSAAEDLGNGLWISVSIVRDVYAQCSIAICRLINDFIINFKIGIHIFDGGDEIMTIFLRSYSITITIKSTETQPSHNEVREGVISCDAIINSSRQRSLKFIIESMHFLTTDHYVCFYKLFILWNQGMAGGGVSGLQLFRENLPKHTTLPIGLWAFKIPAEVDSADLTNRFIVMICQKRSCVLAHW
jgi:hypothetical protein